MKIVVLDTLIDTKDITDISDVEANKRYFLNREAGFVITFMDGSKKKFSEKIPYETTGREITNIKNKWTELQKEVTDQWNKDKHGLPEFNLKH